VRERSPERALALGTGMSEIMHRFKSVFIFLQKDSVAPSFLDLLKHISLFIQKQRVNIISRTHFFVVLLLFYIGGGLISGLFAFYFLLFLTNLNSRISPKKTPFLFKEL